MTLTVDLPLLKKTETAKQNMMTAAVYVVKKTSSRLVSMSSIMSVYTANRAPTDVTVIHNTVHTSHYVCSRSRTP